MLGTLQNVYKSIRSLLRLGIWSACHCYQQPVKKEKFYASETPWRGQTGCTTLFSNKKSGGETGGSEAYLSIVRCALLDLTNLRIPPSGRRFSLWVP